MMEQTTHAALTDRVPVEVLERIPAGWAYLRSGGEWLPVRHLVYLSQVIWDVLHREDRVGVVVSMPPRHGKTEFCTLWVPLWYLATNPRGRVCVATYNADYARELGARALERWESLGMSVDPRARSAEMWRTGGGGWFYAVGVGGALTGRGFDLLVVDDPIKNVEEALSPTYRRRVWDWFQSVAMTRLEPGGKCLVVMTRWHVEDLVGMLLSVDPGRWVEVRLSALAMEGDPLGRQVGEALWPERFSREWLETRRQVMEPHWWWALYQQSPISSMERGDVVALPLSLWQEVGMEWWDSDVWKQTVLSVDPGGSGRGRDRSHSAVQVWSIGEVDGAPRWLLRSAWSGGVGFGELVEVVQDVLRMWDVSEVLVEFEADGRPLVHELEKRLSGRVIRRVKPRGSKAARVAAARMYVTDGSLWYTQASSGVSKVQMELGQWPNGVRDDHVDAFTQMVLWCGKKRRWTIW